MSSILASRIVVLYTAFNSRAKAVKRNDERAEYIHGIILEKPEDCVDQTRMSQECFHRFCSLLREHGRLRDTLHMSVEEQVMLFLHTLGHNVRNRVIAFRFSRSQETVSRYWHIVLQAVLGLYKLLVKQPTGTKVPLEIKNDNRFWPYFKDCVGAIDGTHVPCKVSIEHQARFRGRKSKTTQNVMAACTFDLKFTYVLAGWEGSATDPIVLGDAFKRQNGLYVPPGKYYLVDAGYGNQPGFLAPYRGARYHLNEFSGRTPENANEIFNHRHSSLRNAIERAFGVLKKRFPILDSTQHMSFGTQIKIVVACCIIHNYIMGIDPNDDIMQTYIEETAQTRRRASSQASSSQSQIRELCEESTKWRKFRDDLGDKMYRDYQRSRGG